MTKWQEFGWAGLTKAASDGTHVLMLGLTGSGAFLIHSWILFGLAAAAYVTAVSVQMCDRNFWSEVIKEVRRRPVGLPGDGEVTDETARRFLARITKTRMERTDLIAAQTENGEDNERLMGLVDQVAELERRAVGLVRVVDELGRYMMRQDLGCKLREAERIRQEVEAASEH